VNGFIDYLYTPLGTTSTYNAIADFHNSQITTAPAKPFPACCVFTSRSLEKASNSGDSSVSRPQVLLPQPPVQNSCQLNYSAISFQPPLQSSTELVAAFLFFISTFTDRVENTVFNGRGTGVFTDPLPINGLHNTVVYSPLA
jgi:hypothetical protein